MIDIDPRHLTCRDAAELVTDYIEGALPPGELTTFEEHVVLCDGCAAHLDNLRRLRHAARARPAEEVDADVLQKLTAVLRMAQNPK